MEITKYNQVWEIWLEHRERLQAYIGSKYKNKGLAEEATQEVLLKIYKSCCSGNNINNLNSWLYQISNNVAIDLIKKEKKNTKEFTIDHNESESKSLAEISEVLKPLISLLPEKYSVPLKMADIDGIPQKEIADFLDLGISATKTRIQRARKLLKEEITTCFHLELDKNGIPITASLKDNCLAIKQLKNKC